MKPWSCFVRAAVAPMVCMLVIANGALAPVIGQGQRTAPLDAALLSGLRWRSIGPANTGGRIDDFAVARAAGVPDAIYVAAASGGVFKDWMRDSKAS